jgi:PAS domain S-box-containing protein
MSDLTDSRRNGGLPIETEPEFEVGTLKHRIRELEDALSEAGDSPEIQARKRAVALERANSELEAEIAVRERTEQALRRERDFNSAILETVGALVLVSDVEGRIVMFNRACEAATGFSAHQMIGRYLWDTPLLGELASSAEHDFQSQTGGDFPNQAEGYWVAKDGTRHLIRWSNTCVLAADGSIGHVIGTGIDVTEHRRAEEALRESERRLAKAQEQARIAYWSWSLGDDGVSYVSDQYAQVLGVSAEQNPRRQEEFNRFIHPKDRAATAAFFREVSDEPRDYEVEFRIIRPDGDVRHVVEIGEVYRDDSGAPIGHTGTIQDVTTLKRAENALRESEARLRAIIDQSPADIHLSDVDGRYILVNPQFERWYGTSRKAAEGKTPHEVLPPDFAASSITHCRAAAAAGKAIEKEHQAPFQDGFHTLLTVKFPVPGETAGEPTICTISTDITELKQREAALLAAKQDAELANRAKSEFLANMSHELRTPLSAIIGFAELIRGETLGPLGHPGYGNHASEIESAGRDLLGLINDVIELSRIEAGKLELYESEVDAEQAVRSSLILAGGRAHHSGMALNQDLPEDLPKLFADERTLKQMLLSLLSNAIKFTPSGGAVTVKAWANPEEGYVFQVCDTGIGMSVTDIPKAMVHFGQVNGHHSREFGGTGLGLPLTKSLIELHGGSLDVESARGAGTTVTLRFPPERILTDRTRDKGTVAAPPIKAQN